MSHGTTRSTCPPLPVGPKSCDARCDCRSLRFGDAKVAHNFALCKKNPKNFSNFVSARFPAHRKPDDKNRILEHQHDEYKNPPDPDESDRAPHADGREVGYGIQSCFFEGVVGVAFDFFNISGSLFVEKETSAAIRSSAQGVFMIMTNGLGALIGSYLAGWVVNHYGWPLSWYLFAGFSLVVAIVFAVIFKYKHDPNRI
jgi:uncharacterized membrane protein YeaQ/YmgE (transglycosylase-associated protein family)